MATKKLRWFSNPNEGESSVWTRAALVIALLAIGGVGTWFFFWPKKNVELAIKSVDELEKAMDQRKELDRRIDEFVKVYTGHVQTWESIKNPASCQSAAVVTKVQDPPAAKAPATTTDSPSSKAPVFGPSVTSGK